MLNEKQSILDIASAQREQTTIHTNLAQDVITVTEDKLWRCLQEHLKKTSNRQAWIAPASLLVSLIAALISSDFKDFIVPKATWQALFILAAIGSTIWLVTTIPSALVKVSEQEFIDRLKHGSPLSPRD